MRAALEEIRQVASGEKQVAIDDTEGMAWIDKRAQAALASPQPDRTQATLSEPPYCESHGVKGCVECFLGPPNWAETPEPAPTFEEPLRASQAMCSHGTPCNFFCWECEKAARVAAPPPTASFRTRELLQGQEALCGTAETAATSMNEGILPIANNAAPSGGLLLPEEEWIHLSNETRNKLQTWFRLATERLQLILDEPQQQAAEDKK